MKIAVASQTKTHITEHAGHCQQFWIYDVSASTVQGKTLLELSREQTFHHSSAQAAQPLNGVQVLIAGGMGQGLVRRLARQGIEGIVTTETDPDQAVQGYLAGTLPLGEPEAHSGPQHQHQHQHGHRHGTAAHVCQCGG